jgi:hypothetical protein
MQQDASKVWSCVVESSCTGTLFQMPVGSRMLGNKRAHRLVPTLIIGKAKKSLSICAHSADYCPAHMLHAVVAISTYSE